MNLNPKKWLDNLAKKKRLKEAQKLAREEQLRREREEQLRLQQQASNRSKILLLILFCVGIGMYFTYWNFIYVQQKGWVTTIEGTKVYGFYSSGDNTYSWKGKTLGGVAHDSGVLSQTHAQKTTTKRISASWGSISTKDWQNVKDGKFLGKVSSDEPNGFGVLAKGSRTMIGDFNNGNLVGNIMEFDQDLLIYRGQYGDNAYNGFGTLYKNGEVFSGNWKDGKLNNGYLDEKGKSITRIFNRYFGSTGDEDGKPVKLSTQEFSMLDKEGFQQYLALQLNNYIERQVVQIVDKRTSFFSLQPIRMFWQSLFSSRLTRSNGWTVAFESNGLTKDDLEFFINSYVTDYNNKNINHIKLKNIELTNIVQKEIIDDKSFNLMHDMEFAGWSENFWFDALLCFLISSLITFILKFTPIGPVALILDIGVGIIGFIIGLLLSFIFADIKPDYAEIISSNYVTYLLNQEIFTKIL